MNMDYPSNSQKSKSAPEEPKPEKNIEAVVKGDVVRRKKPLGKRFLETFGGGDANSVWEYVLFDVLVPAAKDTVADAVSQGVERMIFGEARSSSRRTGSRPGSSNGYVGYDRYSKKPVREEPRSVSRQSRARHDFDEIILDTRVEAEEVIDRLFDLVSKYDAASVSDLYELVGISANYTDKNWGWTDIRGAGVTRIRNGYLLDLPKPEPID